MRVLELGSYVAPAYAGMILAEQGHGVTKWTTTDPIHELRHGDQLWDWINHGKTLIARHASEVTQLQPGMFDAIIDNARAATWERWGVDPAVEADRLGATWVSLRADDDGRSFDVIAQARAWGDIAPIVPFYLGDTAAGLWLAFKALAASTGHHVIRQGAALAKLVEGELVVDRPAGRYPWDEGNYGVTPDGVAVVEFRGERIEEPPRAAAWRRVHLMHSGGRFTI